MCLHNSKAYDEVGGLSVHFSYVSMVAVLLLVLNMAVILVMGIKHLYKLVNLS